MTIPKSNAAARLAWQPLSGVRVVEFSQLVMGPTCGLILADLGADVVKVEPLSGDRTRLFKGPAAGFFANYCRNKMSLAVDTSTTEGQEIIKRLLGHSDILIENFRPGLMQRFGLDYATVSAFAPHLIYCSLKGYLPGPYENRLALDEVVQMMGGLAYMTGPEGKPMRAGASVNDIMGGMFGVIAIQAALAERQHTGRGRHIQSALFENNVFLMGQAMMYEAVTGQPAVSYAIKDSPWAVYDLFDTEDGQKIFVSVVGEDQWTSLCQTFGRDAWLHDPRLATNQGRVDQRAWLIPDLAQIFAQWSLAELASVLEKIGLPFGPVNKPSDLFNDPHLAASGGLLDVRLPDGRMAKTPALPLSVDGERLQNRREAPGLGEHTREILSDLGYTAVEIERLVTSRTVGLSATAKTL